MRYILSLAVLAILTITLASVSASVPACSTVETTFVTGIVYDQSTGEPIEGADVTVDCNGRKRNVDSDENGSYVAQYPSTDCDYGDPVSVSAVYNGLNGESKKIEWFTDNARIGCLELIVNVACGDVPLIPEFGMFIGTLTVVSAIGVFFFVRRK